MSWSSLQDHCASPFRGWRLQPQHKNDKEYYRETDLVACLTIRKPQKLKACLHMDGSIIHQRNRTCCSPIQKIWLNKAAWSNSPIQNDLYGDSACACSGQEAASNFFGTSTANDGGGAGDLLPLLLPAGGTGEYLGGEEGGRQNKEERGWIQWQQLAPGPYTSPQT